MPGGSHGSEQAANYSVTANRQAPGLEPLLVQMQVEAQPSNVASPALEAEGDFSVVIDYYPHVQGKVPASILEGAPGTRLLYSIQVSNFGNAETVVEFGLPEPPGGWDWQAPAPITLSSMQKDPSKANATVVVEVMGDGASETPLLLTMTPHAAADPSKAGAPITVNLLARVRGIPDAGPTFVLLAFAIAWTAWRRRA